MLLFALLLILTSAAAAQNEAEEPAEDKPVKDHLYVGNTTPMRGKFFTGLWEDVISDADVRSLIHGYNLVIWNGEIGAYVHDPSVVNNMAILDDEYGDRAFMIVLQDDLYYSDGTKITAWDYAFSYLLSIAPEIDEIGGHSAKRPYLYGYDQYMDGTVNYLAGIQVLADDQLMITLDHEYLPYFYEIGLLMCNPYPISVIAPGVAIRDDGYGVYLANEDESVTEPVFNAALLQKTILDPATGYQTHPSIVSGPYKLTSWDGTTTEFEINPYYKGNQAGKLPLIPYLTYTLADNDTMVSKLESGELDLLNKVTKSSTASEALQLVGKGYRMANYPRTGIAFISFGGQNPAFQSKNVRQAMAWCMDRDEVIGQYTGYYGLRVDSFYGLGQWMYGVINGTTPVPIDPPEDENDLAALVAYERELEEWESLNFDNLRIYELNTGNANLLLERDGWVLNADGIREKEIDGETVRLSFTMICPEGNNINEILEELWVPNLRAVGIELKMESVPMPELIDRFLFAEKWGTDLVYVARNFEGVYDPSTYFQVDEEGKHSWFTTKIVDEELYQDAVDMRVTEPGNTLEYVEEWLLFIERFNETLPMIPIYSNVYFDFYSPLLQDYYISQNETWGQAIVGAWLGEESLEEDAETFDADEFDTFENDAGSFTFFEGAEDELIFEDF